MMKSLRRILILILCGRERKLSKGQNQFYDDYAHHPTEIKSILESVKSVFQNRKIISIFQPHRYSRVRDLKLKFAKSFINHIFSIGDIPRRSRPFEITCLTDSKHARIDSIFWSVSERT